MNKYLVSALVVLSLLLVFLIGLNAFNPKKAFPNDLVNNTPKKEYLNKKYGFSLILPDNVYTIEDTLSNSMTVLYFVDQNRKNYHDASLKYGDDFAYNFSDSGKIYFTLAIISKKPSTEEDIGAKNFIQDRQKELEKFSKSYPLKETSYLAEGKELNFYVVPEKSGAYSSSLDIKKLPSADAFFEDENNIYHFYLANSFSESSDKIMGRIGTMRKTIKSIKFVD